MNESYDGCGLLYQCPIDPPAFFHGREDLQKLIVSFPVIGFILFMLIEQINLEQIGTASFEHLFGVARLGTQGENHQKKIILKVTKAQLSVQITEKAGFAIRRKRLRNFARTIDCISRRDQLLVLSLILPSLDYGQVLMNA
jgi:hypothetical protein